MTWELFPPAGLGYPLHREPYVLMSHTSFRSEGSNLRAINNDLRAVSIKTHYMKSDTYHRGSPVQGQKRISRTERSESEFKFDIISSTRTQILASRSPSSQRVSTRNCTSQYSEFCSHDVRPSRKENQGAGPSYLVFD